MYRYVSTQPERGKFCGLACFHKRNTKYQRDELECPQCGMKFLPTSSQARALATGEMKTAYCSAACYGGHRKTKCNGAANPHWKGGKTESRGYIYLREKQLPVSPYIASHRKIAAEKIGRPLRRNEVVHHINGNKTDNRPENLDVLTISQHMRLHGLQQGKRVEAI